MNYASFASHSNCISTIFYPLFKQQRCQENAMLELQRVNAQNAQLSMQRQIQMAVHAQNQQMLAYQQQQRALALQQHQQQHAAAQQQQVIAFVSH